MQFVTTVHAFDVIDRVQVTAVVRMFDGMEKEPSSIVFECTTTFRGSGEPDPIEWLRDALVGLLEDI